MEHTRRAVLKSLGVLLGIAAVPAKLLSPPVYGKGPLEQLVQLHDPDCPPGSIYFMDYAKLQTQRPDMSVRITGLLTQTHFGDLLTEKLERANREWESALLRDGMP